MKRIIPELVLVGLVGLGYAAALWAADAVVKPRLADPKAESVVRELPGAVKVDTKPKPRAWAFVNTTESGVWRIVARSPSGKEQALAEVEMVIPAGKVGVISVRTSLGVVDEPKAMPEEVIP